MRPMTNLAELLKLPATERLELIEALWDSLDAESANLPPISKELQEELERRMAEHEADPSSALDWEDVRRDLQARYK
jgi:putative addiction module component (TIGR02574 family)